MVDEAHKNKLRVTAHIFTLDDAKGLLKAGLDAFAHARLSKAGVKIALDTDGNVSWAHHLEMEDMVASGMTPAQVLDANPLDNITNTRRISSVYLRGAAVDRAAILARVMGSASQ